VEAGFGRARWFSGLCKKNATELCEGVTWAGTDGDRRWKAASRVWKHRN